MGALFNWSSSHMLQRSSSGQKPETLKGSWRTWCDKSSPGARQVIKKNEMGRCENSHMVIGLCFVTFDQIWLWESVQGKVINACQSLQLDFRRTWWHVGIVANRTTTIGLDAGGWTGTWYGGKSWNCSQRTQLLSSGTGTNTKNYRSPMETNIWHFNVKFPK